MIRLGGIPTNGNHPCRQQGIQQSRDLNQGTGLLFNTSPSSILSWYFSGHASETGQCPKSFHLWSCMSMLAALAQDRWYFQKWPGVRTLPNIYVLLVGPSGLGKDTAINVAVDYLRPYRDLTRTFIGRLTHAAFTDFLCQTREAIPAKQHHTGMAGENLDPIFPHTDSAVAWVVTPELAQSISAGSKAAELIKLFTSIYTATGREFEEHTRQWGYRLATTPCVNWIAGTTQEWLIKSIGMDDIKGGFASRCLWIVEDYDLMRMCGFPRYPANLSEIGAYIAWRLYQIAVDEGGEMYLSPAAKLEIDGWYTGWKLMAQDTTTDRSMLPLYMRGHDLALKLAMLLRIADYDPKDELRLQIRQREMYTAVRWVEQLLLIHYPRILRLSRTADQDIVKQAELARIMINMSERGKKKIDRAELLRMCRSNNITGRQINDAVVILQQMGDVMCIPRIGGGGVDYLWQGKEEDWSDEVVDGQKEGESC